MEKYKMAITFKTELRSFQKEHVKFHLLHPRSANWSEMGVGKTVIALKYITELINHGLITNALILCPLSVLHTWEIEILKHTNLSFVPLVGDLATKITLLESSHNLYLISYDSIPGRRGKGFDTYGIMMSALLRKQFDLVVGDEISMIKGYGTLRTRAVTLLCDYTPYTLFLDGAPLSGSNPSELFNIYRALDGGKTFGKNFFATRNRFFRNIGHAFPRWEMKDEMLEEFQTRMYDIAVRIRKDECLDLPPKIFSLRFCYLSKEQVSLYAPIVEELIHILKLKEGTVFIKNAMNKIWKLAQITSGFLYTNNEPFYFKSNPKLDLLNELIEEIGNEKIIVYCYWIEDIKLIGRMIKKKSLSHDIMYGATPHQERVRIVDDFQKGNTQILISNIGVGGYGLTLSSSHTIIYYDFSFKVRDFIQSQDRIHRHGQINTCLYLPLLTRGTIDEYIYNKLITNASIAESIVDGMELKNSLEKFLGGEVR